MVRLCSLAEQITRSHDIPWQPRVRVGRALGFFSHLLGQVVGGAANKSLKLGQVLSGDLDEFHAHKMRMEGVS